MRPISGVIISTATPTDKIVENIITSRSRDIVPVYNLPEWREGRAIAVVGGGPSLATQLHKLKEFDVILAAGSVHDYLVQNEIRPTYCIIVDPDPIVTSYLKNIYHVDNDCKYLVASQCDPSVFVHLQYNYIYQFHCAGNDELPYDGEPTVGGGCTVGTRAIVMATCMGYRKIHLFGMDTCIVDDKHHAYDFENPEIETIGKIHEIAIGSENGRKFKVAEYMLGQLHDFQQILKSHANRLEITVHGEGLLAYVMELGHQKLRELS